MSDISVEEIDRLLAVHELVKYLHNLFGAGREQGPLIIALEGWMVQKGKNICKRTNHVSLDRRWDRPDLRPYG